MVRLSSRTSLMLLKKVQPFVPGKNLAVPLWNHLALEEAGGSITVKRTDGEKCLSRIVGNRPKGFSASTNIFVPIHAGWWRVHQFPLSILLLSKILSPKPEYQVSLHACPGLPQDEPPEKGIV